MTQSPSESIASREREALLHPPHGVARRATPQHRVAEDRVLVDVEPRDVADDAIGRDALLLLEGPDGGLRRGPEVPVDRARVMAGLLERRLELADGRPARAALQQWFGHHTCPFDSVNEIGRGARTRASRSPTPAR
jgi:hypothetical protein